MKYKLVTLLLSLMLITALLTACSQSSPTPASNSGAQSPANTPAATKAASTKAASKSTPTNTPAPKGDGTLKIKLKVLNPEQKQDKYAVSFASTGGINKGKAMSPRSFAGPFIMEADGEAVIDIDKDLKNFLYVHSSIDGPLCADLVVTRVEDSHIRNPLCAPIKLTFEELLTTDKGNEITVDVTDSALNDLYDEDVFIVKVVPEEIQDGGGYPTIYYSASGAFAKGSRLQRGSAGPDFLVAFPVKEFKSHGIREGSLVILDMDNKEVSEHMKLTFDENGLCEQGALVMINKTK